MKRGVVASPMGFEVLAGGGFMQTTGLSETDLNYYSLYWDEIIILVQRVSICASKRRRIN